MGKQVTEICEVEVGRGAGRSHRPSREGGSCSQFGILAGLFVGVGIGGMAAHERA